MLLLHQLGSVYVGEVVRYTLTYTPSHDRILPPPTHLHVKIKNTSAIPLRAAYLHGPYTLYVAGYPSTFDPNKKFTKQQADREGEPNYEPMLKAGGSWGCKLTVPEHVREDAQHQGHVRDRKSFTWIIEIASQVLFSTSACVHYELLVGRDEKSVTLGFTGVVSSSGAPGRLEDHQRGRTEKGTLAQAHSQPQGVFTKAVKLKVEDTTSLWDSPAFPSHDEHAKNRMDMSRDEPQKTGGDGERPRKKRKKIHLVVLTHGLHSNLGADMLFMKESIESTARQARKDARNARRNAKEQEVVQQYDFGRDATDQRTKSVPDVTLAPTQSFESDHQAERSDEDEDEEEVVVKGFKGNAVKTERGIQYLGKRLAKYVLSITYPDQPYLPVKSTITQSISRTFTGAPKPTQVHGKQPSHKNSSIAKDENSQKHDLPYQITSVSFVSHSLGGLVQTYAIAYIQKHSPEFFDKIRPINFVAMASPFLGLSNENPMYVKFALDFGLVGRTGQDLGLTWRAPTIARNGWGAMVGGFSDNAKKEPDPGAKPLLRILPNGPAHVALKRFRNRSVYSNVVNDGIVPLRTSCLLFLDWRGLSRVEKAKRENGLVGTMVNWGLNEITGQNSTAPRKGLFEDLFADSGDEVNKPQGRPRAKGDPGSAVPQAEASEGVDDQHGYDGGNEDDPQARMLSRTRSPEQNPTFWSSLTNFFRPQAGQQRVASPKQQKIYQRSQTMSADDVDDSSSKASKDPEQQEGSVSPSDHRKLLVRGSSLYTNNSDNEGLDAPPRTTVFESAGDLLNPPLPPKEFLLDPGARPRTIFHDRVYHPEDIPPPPTKRQRTLMRSRPSSNSIKTVPNQNPHDMQNISSGQSSEPGNMRIEEKIARAYHKDMAWRKVLVRLEPDAHNNIIVRRMFANAYGWPVVKHMCDTHFGYTAAATTADEDESTKDRAKQEDVPATKQGEEVKEQTEQPDLEKNEPERPASADSLPNKEDHEIDALHQRQRNIQAAQSRQPVSSRKAQPRDARSPSELRESRDQISDLVSTVSAQGEPVQNYSSMHSGTAALHRLARQDSARWSDRFFDSEEEEEDDEGQINEELARAYDRGLGPQNLSASPRSTKSSKRAESKRGSVGPGAGILVGSEGTSGLVAEPELLESRRSSLRNSVGVSDPQTEPHLLSSTTTSVGLGMNVSHVVDEVNEDDGEGIAEQVARRRTHSSGARDEHNLPRRPKQGERKDSVD